MKNGSRDWNNDFPIEEEVEDHAGRTWRFLITCHQGPLGFTVRAQEQEAQGTGYENILAIGIKDRNRLLIGGKEFK